ncbi:hypothetical protein JMK10_11725 [Rhodovulum sulfidophilum]|nr:hypothetical protein [Rhodovulum sulfidophilum]MCE8433885.1 hypothetical protein [Rhodovulum sulfidophilum]MCF4117467.1 hypothetical protein [Rhodovulum sulfidophilum]
MSFAFIVSPPLSEKSGSFAHHLHFFLQAAVLPAQLGQFRGLGLLPPDGLSRAGGRKFEPPALDLRRRHAELPRDAGLRSARLGQARNGLFLEFGGEVTAGLSAHVGSLSLGVR